MPSDYFTVECWTSMAMAMAGNTFFATGKQSDMVRAPFDSVEVAEQSGLGIDLFSEMLSSAEAQRLH